jgi:hypothetical protein
LEGLYHKANDKYAFTNDRIRNVISFNSIEDLNKLLNKLTSINNKIKVHYEEDFSKKVFLKSGHALCNSEVALAIAHVSDNETFDRLMKKGECIGSDEVDKEAFIEEKSNTTSMRVSMIKVNGEYRWISEDGYR